MTARIGNRLAWGILVATVLGTLIAYPSLPPVMATHFNATGQVNGTMSVWIGAFLPPCITFVVLILFTVIPQIDPLKVNFQYFRRQYDTFVVLLMLFFAVIQATIISRNLGVMLDPMYVVLPGVGILMYYLGFLMPKTKRNWFIGIRTPWTISSDHVWQKTHELGGTLFKVQGVICILAALSPAYALWIMLIPLACIVVGLVVYSYAVYERDRKDTL